MTCFDTAFTRCPLIAILRGVQPHEALDIGRVLVDTGFTIIEVPLNSPAPYQSIALLQDTFGDRILVGAGTVTSPDAVGEVASHGGRLVVMPHADLAVITEAKKRGMICTPGVATPTEGFAALHAGADALKLFPAEQLGTKALTAWKSVFPRSTRFIPVGGITPDNMQSYLAAGAAGFGLGSALYRAGNTAADVGRAADRFMKALS
ncbi:MULTISPECIES: 2-dehydro-3-deoxy-6-phosphogalactonate aldolase [Komagataeibacter]|uniref:2-dehydro-3-deoxy-6-phosphogalactonate aldolase n=1 Tax=Komagataeibacter oboediens TaxID=65958 RepID=A0ABS5SRR4_9PROT|nr:MULTISPECIES: 2-dehydro-3-deoxy-6-phosphogalactonate aldolase [Komagataeibacter]MBE7731342.1 2-dehydro-3-deoxy-6-phosphogalactonate aldolase [Komagataeibacter sp. FXV3]MBT0676923.1 2-dehydro-3-deoxy-6-phosphogalactonate aldolase [Komagataeibacter oboediens]MBT0680253.1 2-dehydro-3-deoxy-6-phosphogalactonate aldolase [Komagataeibacter oboediens]GCE80484.1 KDPG aldolase [Komagataeibacter oboediens]GCE91937.1 KDPG aldolase [Komagataeibacter diospyri]